jgi:hypothetical protein
VLLVLEIAAGIVLAVLILAFLQLLLAGAVWTWQSIWNSIEDHPWILWTLGITGVGLYVLWLIDHPK